LLFLSVWLVLIILVPAGINAYLSSKYPIPEAQSAAIAQRDGYHVKWDTDKRATIEKREQSSTQIASFIPNMHLQLVFNQLAGTSMPQHMAYLDATDAFHEKLRLFFYPKVFEGEQADSIDWSQFPPAYYKAQSAVQPLQSMMPLLVVSIVILVISIPTMRRL